MNEAQVAWTAGLFCGEGNAGVVRQTRPDGSPRLYVMLQVSMLDGRSLQKFADIWDRSVYSWPYHVDNSRLVYRVACSGRTAERILTTMYPYLRNTDKGEQIERVFAEVGVPLARSGFYVERRVTRNNQGENNPRAKLTNRQRGQIARRIATGRYTYKELAEEYGVTSARIGQIVREAR